MEPAILTCALTGVLTDPRQHPVPVTPRELAAQARDAYHAGAAIMHVHLRDQAPGRGHLASWDPEVARAVVDAIRDACPGVIINLTTGVIGPDISGPVACIRQVTPEIAACNAGSLNYLKLRHDGQWAWPPMMFDNPVATVKAFLDVMAETGAHPELECFDVGIVRSVDLYRRAGLVENPGYNFVMGVASGMPVDGDLLRLLPRWITPGARWQTGTRAVHPLHAPPRPRRSLCEPQGRGADQSLSRSRRAPRPAIARRHHRRSGDDAGRDGAGIRRNGGRCRRHPRLYGRAQERDRPPQGASPRADGEITAARRFDRPKPVRYDKGLR